MAKDIIYQVPNSIKESALLNEADYEKLYKESLENTEEFRSRVVRVDSASEQICLTRNFLGQHAEGERAAA